MKTRRDAIWTHQQTMQQAAAAIEALREQRSIYTALGLDSATDTDISGTVSHADYVAAVAAWDSLLTAFDGARTAVYSGVYGPTTGA